MRLFSKTAVRITLFIIATVSLSQAAATWTTIDVPGAAATYPIGINNLGQIVGLYGDLVTGDHGFLYSGGTFTTIDYPGQTGTLATGINDSGQIVGFYQSATVQPHSFLLEGQTFTNIDFPGSIATSARAINNSGQIVGSYFDANGTHGFLLDKGVFTTIEPPWSGDSVAAGINNLGDIVGFDYDFSANGLQEGFVYSGGKFETKIIFPGADSTLALGVNDKRQIAGTTQGGANSFPRGFAFFRGSFVTFNYPRSKRTEALGINFAGDIVGDYRDPNFIAHGFLRTKGGG